MANYKFNVNSNEYLPLRDVVFNTLRDAILSGSLKPGERLMENHLAEKLGVSRTPIREALRMLELENLVAVVPRRGAQVLDLTEKDIKDVLEVRCALEALGAELACTRMNGEYLERLKKCQEEFRQACAAKDIEKAAESDENFHYTLFESTDNAKLIMIMDNLKTRLYRYRVAYFKFSSSTSTPVEFHDKIIECIENHDKENGARLAALHIKDQTQVILNYVRNK